MSIATLSRRKPTTNCRGCAAPLRSDGSCPPCDFIAFRGAAAAEDAQRRLDNPGPHYGAKQRASDLQTVQTDRRRRLLLAYDARTPANGCAECGRLEADHRPVRGHGFDMPTDRLRLARLKARRALAGKY